MGKQREGERDSNGHSNGQAQLRFICDGGGASVGAGRFRGGARNGKERCVLGDRVGPQKESWTTAGCAHSTRFAVQRLSTLYKAHLLYLLMTGLVRSS